MFLVCVVSFMDVMFVGGGVCFDVCGFMRFVFGCCMCVFLWVGLLGCCSAAFIIVFECVDCCLNMWLFCLCL